MKVKDLQKILADKDPEMRVLVDGYEEGLDDPRISVTDGIANVQGRGKKTTWWRGRYREEQGGRITALVIGR